MLRVRNFNIPVSRRFLPCRHYYGKVGCSLSAVVSPGEAEGSEPAAFGCHRHEGRPQVPFLRMPPPPRPWDTRDKAMMC